MAKKEMVVEKKTISKEERELQEKQLREADAATIRKGAEELVEKRDELLQEVIELQNEIGTLEARKGELQTKLKQRMTGLVFCEKIIGCFGKIIPESGATTG